MYLALLDLLYWFQASGTAPSSAAATGDASAAAPGGEPGMSCAMQGGFMAVFFVIMYFLMIRPENKRREEQENLLKSLRPGQKVRTSSGILGEIVSIDQNEAVLAIGQKEKIRINVLRSHIAGLEQPPAKTESKTDDKAKAESKTDDKAKAESKADEKNEKKAEEKPADKS